MTNILPSGVTTMLPSGRFRLVKSIFVPVALVNVQVDGAGDDDGSTSEPGPSSERARSTFGRSLVSAGTIVLVASQS